MEKRNRTPPLLSCLLITWNRKEILKKNLISIQKNLSVPYEVIIVDNASEDGTFEMLQKEFASKPSFKLLQMDENCGIEAYNRGAKEAEGEYLLILDDDSFPQKGVDKKLVQIFKEEPAVGIIACNIKNDKTKEKYISWHLPQVAEEKSWVNFIGCGAAIRRRLFEEVGFYPAPLFLYENELDVSLKVLSSGYRIYYHEDIVVFHDYSSAKRGTDMQIYHGTKNKLLLLWKFFPYPMVVQLSLSFFAANLLLALKRGKAMLRLKAWLHALFLLPRYIAEGGAKRASTLQYQKNIAPFLKEFELTTWVERLRKEEEKGRL